MYHFILGLRGALAAHRLCRRCSGLAPGFFFVLHNHLQLSACRLVREVPVTTLQAVRQMTQSTIPEVQTKNKDRNNDHHGRRLNFLERRRRDLPHLGAHVVIESLDPLRPGLDRVVSAFSCAATDAIFFSCFPANCPNVSKIWQGRRDSNPQVRFWRPTV